MNHSYLRNIYLRLAGVVMVVVVLALAASSYLSQRAFERALSPVMAKKVATVGASVRSLVLKAVEHKIGFRELYGVEQKFDDVIKEIPEVTYMAMTDAQGNILHQRLEPRSKPAKAEAYFRSAPVLALLNGQELGGSSVHVAPHYLVSLPIVTAAGPLGILHIGVDENFVNNIVLDMLYDVLVVLVVALFFTLELLHFMAGARLEAALKALGDVIELGAAGNFAQQPNRVVERKFGTLLDLLASALARVNAGHAALLRDIEAGRHRPAHERPAGIAAAQAGLAALGKRFQFGVQEAGPPADEAQLPKVRAPLFVFILAEELTRSFLPNHVHNLLVPIPGLSPELVVGLPIALFMLIVAIGQPYIGAYTERVGHRKVMTQGAVLAAVGFLATAMAHNVLDLLLWRSLCAMGYAMVFVSAQGYVLDHSSLANRARSFALFIGAIMVATVCGPSIGGILADNLGVRPTFVIAAVLALASMAAMQNLPGPSQRSGPARQVAKPPTLREIGTLMLSPRFMTVTAMAAMPAKILLTGICFYLVPMYMLSIGANQAMTGRILMVYAVVMVLMGPLTAGLANTRQRMEWLVGGGLMVSGLGGVLMLAGGGVPWVFTATALIGIGQSMSMAAQSALVSERCPEDVARMGEHTVYGVYRLLERLGNAIGPLAAALLALHYGYRTGFVVIGTLAMLCGICFVLTTQRESRPVLATA